MSDRNPDVTAALGLLLAVWRALPPAQRSALQLSTPTTGTRKVQASARDRTVLALVRKGYTGGDAGYGKDPRTLTPLGIMLRSIGMEADAVAARRRFSKRKNPAEKAVGRA
jgi:hypothetical protein